MAKIHHRVKRHFAHVSTQGWIAVGALSLFGLGILYLITTTPPSTPNTIPTGVQGQPDDGNQ